MAVLPFDPRRRSAPASRDSRPALSPPESAASSTAIPSGPSGPSDEEILKQAHSRFHTAAEAEHDLRVLMLDDLKFRAGEHWPDNIKQARALDQRPCLTINRLPQFVRRVTNEVRQNRPAIQVSPVDSGSDPETAEVLQGIIRHIEQDSQASVAYDTACEHQATIGRGWIRVLTEYADEDSFDQRIAIDRIRNPFTVYSDPSCQRHDYFDARYAFVVSDWPKDEYRAAFPKSQMASLEEFSSIGDTRVEWLPEGHIRVAEYFWVESGEEEICLVADPRTPGATLTLLKSVVDRLEQELPPEAPRPEVLKRRIRETKTVHWALINAVEVLDRKVWPGKYIPLIPVLGDEIDIDGRVDLRGIVRDARDPMRMYDYWVSAETETIALAPRAPYVGVEGSFRGHETQWKLANTRNLPYLEYNNLSLSGTPTPPPQRQVYEPPIQAIVAATKQSDNDLKAVTGFYDASLGERGPEQSGKAILARQRQGDVGSLNYVDNLARALTALGKLLIDLIPKVYDTPRILRILGKDEQPKTVMVHAGQEGVQQPDGIDGIFDLGVGRYDVTVSTGPSYASQRQENSQMLMEMVRAFPPIAQQVIPLWAANMDAPVFRQLAEALKPPDQDAMAKIPPQVQAQMQQAQQAIEALSQENAALKESEKMRRLELESRERIAQIQADTQIAIAQSKALSAEGIALLEARIQGIEQLVNLDVARIEGQSSAMQAQMAHQAAMEQQSAQSDSRFQEIAAQNQQTQNAGTDAPGQGIPPPPVSALAVAPGSRAYPADAAAFSANPPVGEEYQ